MLIVLLTVTHWYLVPQLPPALKGVDLILHAVDIGTEAVVAALARIAPVTAVAGNNDAKLAQLALPLRVDLNLDGVKLNLVHRLIYAVHGSDTRICVYGLSNSGVLVVRGVWHMCKIGRAR